MRTLLFLCLLMAACGRPDGAPPARVGTNDANAHRDNTLLDKNKVLTEREDHDIDDWVARHGAALIRTGTGVRYKLVRDVPGDSAQPGQAAVIRFQVELLDGTVCYTSGGGTETFRIEHDDVESGLHEAIQHMSSGDSAVIVIPSHRAFGLAGDQDKIPMRSTVVYRLGLVTLRAS